MFPMKNSVLDDFPPCPPAQAPLKSANFIFIVVSLSLSLGPADYLSMRSSRVGSAPRICDTELLLPLHDLAI